MRCGLRPMTTAVPEGAAVRISACVVAPLWLGRWPCVIRSKSGTIAGRAPSGRSVPFEFRTGWRGWAPGRAGRRTGVRPRRQPLGRGCACRLSGLSISRRVGFTRRLLARRRSRFSDGQTTGDRGPRVPRSFRIVIEMCSTRRHRLSGGFGRRVLPPRMTGEGGPWWQRHRADFPG